MTSSDAWVKETGLILQVRREMRFYQDKEIAGYNSASAQALIVQFANAMKKISMASRDLKHPLNIDYPTLREMERLKQDLELFISERKDSLPFKAVENTNVLLPLSTLISALKRKLIEL